MRSVISLFLLQTLFFTLNLNTNAFASTCDVLDGGKREHPKGQTSSTVPRILLEYGMDISREVRGGAPIVGRAKEVGSAIEILMQTRKSCPLLVGDPEVGKTAVAEAIAQRLPEGQTVIAIDMSAVITGVPLNPLTEGGAQMEGAASLPGRVGLEERFKEILRAAEHSNGKIVLLIDGIDMILDAGPNMVGMLSRTSVPIIGVTSYRGYQKIETTGQLRELFTKVEVSPTSVQETVNILRRHRKSLEKSHGVTIQDDAIIAVAALSDRFVADSALPGKAIALLDRACAKAKASAEFLPTSLHEVNAQIVFAEAERESLDESLARITDPTLSQETDARIKQIDTTLQELRARKVTLGAEHQQQKANIAQLKDLETKIADAKKRVALARSAGDQSTVAQIELYELRGERGLYEQMRALQRKFKDPLLVNQDSVAEVVSEQTGIKVGDLKADEKEKLKGLLAELTSKVVDQLEAVTVVDAALQRAGAGINDPDKPIGSFLMMGPTGVGKSETAKVTAKALGIPFKALDMTEFKGAHSVSRLIGAPPGYVGYDEGGQLTNFVRAHPYALILFDEIEKADPEVFDVFLQILDEGRLTDGQGRTVSFKNTAIMMTSNLGVAELTALQKAYAEMPKEEREKYFDEYGDVLPRVRKKIFEDAFLAHFRKPELWGRVDEVVMYEPLSRKGIEKILQLQLANFVTKQLEPKGIKLDIGTEATNWLAINGYDAVYGARPLKKLIRKALVTEIARLVNNNQVKHGDTIHVGVNKGSLEFTVQHPQVKE